MSELESVIKEFLVESYENLDQLDRDLVALEKNPRDRDRLSSVFRTIHTIKGTCGFFGFSKLESVTHVGENLLSRLRDGLLLLDPHRTSVLLAMLDAVREMLAQIEKTGADGQADYSQLIERLNFAQEDREQPNRTPAPTPTPLNDSEQESPSSAESRVESLNADVSHKQYDAVVGRLGGLLHKQGFLRLEDLSTALAKQEAGDRRRIGEILVDLKFVKVEQIQEALRVLNEPTGQGNVIDTNIRVDVGLLDKLMNLVGELVLARNQILQFNATQKDPAFLSTTQRLNLITSELQEGVMKTRMQPIGNIWNRFPRVVRDLAVTCGKEVKLEMEGKETELDKTIIEAIKDPLTHIVRNSVDHGIEKAEVRVANGKPACGTLLLRAFHEGGKVNIEIIDDGAGVNTERVKAKAIERGLISREQAARMNDREATHLLFLPGFSTAEKITNVSGRGVGMDVVKTNIEKIGGTVDIQSQPGHGTTLKIKIPLTLAIIPALIVTSAGDRFAIPQVSLLELVRLEGEQVGKSIEHIHGAPVYRLRGNLLPLVYLSHELAQQSAANNANSDAINIVVLQADDRQFGLVVEAINDTEEIVVKPLGKLLKGIPVFAGSAIMGDGKVALILDVLGIAQRSGVVSEVRDRTRAEQASRASDKANCLQTLLLLGMGTDRRAAIPLSMVARLEEIPKSQIERADGHEVVRYRGQIMPLIRLSSVVGTESYAFEGDSTPQGAGSMQVVVHSRNGNSVGLVVDRILDIVETSLEVHRETRHDGIVASAVIQDRVTDLLDVQSIIRSADPNYFEIAAV